MIKSISFIICFTLCCILIPFNGLPEEQKANNQHKKFINSIGMEFVYIPPGTFTMGPARLDMGYWFAKGFKPFKVTFKQGFYMQTTEVTQKQFSQLMGFNPSAFQGCGGDCPADNISWENAKKFIKILNEKENTTKYRLPYEAEWEYACKAGTTTPFSFGKCIVSNQVNFNGAAMKGCPKSNFPDKTTPVASYPPNPWGLYDMHGNVREWCEDRYFTNYKHTPRQYPIKDIDKVMPEAPARVMRGGYFRDGAATCRSDNRIEIFPAGAFSSEGFRVVMAP